MRTSKMHSRGAAATWWLAAVATTAAILIEAEPARCADGETLAQQVTIRRTEYGIPHIQGETLEAVAFGLGYCQGQDHLINIMRGIVGVRGELAATFGPDQDNDGDNKYVDLDLRTRQFRIYGRAVDSYHTLDPEYRSMVEGFAAGLNYYVAKHRADVPDWVPEVIPHDVAAYGVAGVMRFAFDRGRIVNQFLKSQGVANVDGGLGADQLAIDSAGGDMMGSNMWALSPNRSRSGRALLMGNPHQGWAPVSTYYEAHLIVPGKLNFYGSTFIGRPVLTTGWNEHLGWSHTVNYPDLEEIYELTLDPDRPDHYTFDGGSVPIERDDVTIQVRTGDESKAESRTFWHTPLGPVIHRTDSKIFVLRSACYDNLRAYEQWLRMSQATSLEEFRQALALQRIPMFNICYADRAGNILYLWNGTVPNLPHEAHSAEAVPANRSSDIWTAFHAADELPQLFNPAGGYVQNCNSPPYFTNLSAPLARDKFPPHYPANNVSLRSQHSLRLVHNDRKLSLEEVCQMKHSPLMLVAERVKDDLIDAVRKSQPNSEIESAVSVLERWDNTVAIDSRGGALFENWWDRYFKRGARNHETEWSADQPTETPRGLSDPERAVKEFAAAVDEVKQLYGRLDVTWGDVHRIRKGSVDLPVSGGSGFAGCFRVLAFGKDDDGKLVARGGDSWVFAVEFSEPPRGYTVVAYSQSDVEDSPHFADQAPLFSAGKMKPAAFTDAQIQEQLLSEYHPGKE